ncbi:MAG: hypothetical protein JST76_01880, partial [Bacteroidetes bacterium]|nr:hypothetical protein [Bacteroidota bacterium]
MKSKMYFLAGTLSLALISCKGYDEILVSTHTQDIAGKNRLYTIPLTVDLNIASSRVTGSYSSKQLVSVEYAKTQANADALQKANADILIEPQYYVEIKDNKIEAQVVGYPAH